MRGFVVADEYTAAPKRCVGIAVQTRVGFEAQPRLGSDLVDAVGGSNRRGSLLHVAHLPISKPCEVPNRCQMQRECGCDEQAGSECQSTAHIEADVSDKQSH